MSALGLESVRFRSVWGCGGPPMGPPASLPRPKANITSLLTVFTAVFSSFMSPRRSGPACQVPWNICPVIKCPSANGSCQLTHALDPLWTGDKPWRSVFRPYAGGVCLSSGGGSRAGGGNTRRTRGVEGEI